jgi:hypothetical protein
MALPLHISATFILFFVNSLSLSLLSQVIQSNNWRSIITQHLLHALSPYYIYVSYHHLSPLYYTCLFFVPISTPNSPCEALSRHELRQTMVKEVCSLQINGNWELVILSPVKSLVVFCGSIQLRLVAKGCTVTTVRLLLSIVAIRHWHIHRLDKNAFLHGNHK